MSDAPNEIWIGQDTRYEKLPWQMVVDEFDDEECDYWGEPRGLSARYIRADLVEAKDARITELEAAITLFIKYDSIASRPDEQHVDEYNHAIEAAKAAMRDMPNE